MMTDSEQRQQSLSELAALHLLNGNIAESVRIALKHHLPTGIIGENIDAAVRDPLIAEFIKAKQVVQLAWRRSPSGKAVPDTIYKVGSFADAAVLVAAHAKLLVDDARRKSEVRPSPEQSGQVRLLFEMNRNDAVPAATNNDSIKQYWIDAGDIALKKTFFFQQMAVPDRPFSLSSVSVEDQLVSDKNLIRLNMTNKYAAINHIDFADLIKEMAFFCEDNITLAALVGDDFYGDHVRNPMRGDGVDEMMHRDKIMPVKNNQTGPFLLRRRAHIDKVGSRPYFEGMPAEFVSFRQGGVRGEGPAFLCPVMPFNDGYRRFVDPTDGQLLLIDPQGIISQPETKLSDFGGATEFHFLTFGDDNKCTFHAFYSKPDGSGKFEPGRIERAVSMDPWMTTRLKEKYAYG